MTRIELSALPLMRTDADGLNLSAVTGKSCACRTVRRGCRRREREEVRDERAG